MNDKNLPYEAAPAREMADYIIHQLRGAGSLPEAKSIAYVKHLYRAALASPAAQAQPVALTGPEFLQWTAQWFGPDCDEDYLSRAVAALPGVVTHGAPPLPPEPAAQADDEYEPMLVADIARELGRSAVEVCAALRTAGLGDYSVNMAVTRKMAREVRAALAAPKALAPDAAAERAAFEKMIAKDCGDLSTFGSGQHVHYRNSGVNHEWIGWSRRAALAASAHPVAGAVKRCEYCDGTGDVVNQIGEWRGTCTMCDAAPPAKAEREVLTDEEALYVALHHADVGDKLERGQKLRAVGDPTYYGFTRAALLRFVQAIAATPARPSEAREPLSDEQIEDALRKAGGRWNGDHWVIEDADLHPFVRGIGIPARVDSEGARDTLSDIAAQQKLLDWNRAQENPPIRIGSEYAVAQAAISFASPARLQHGSEKK